MVSVVREVPCERLAVRFVGIFGGTCCIHERRCAEISETTRLELMML